MKHTYAHQNKATTIDLIPAGKSFNAIVQNRRVPVVVVRRSAEHLDLLIDGEPVQAFITRDGDKNWVTVNGQTLILVNAGESRKSSAHSLHASGELLAPMPGLVRSLTIQEGDQVKKGQTLAVIEAMKMENKVAAPFDGLIKSVLVKVGQTVERDQILVHLSAPTPGQVGEALEHRLS